MEIQGLTLRITEYVGLAVYEAVYPDGQIAGVLHTSFDTIMDIFVYPEYRRRGIATWLWNRAGQPEHSTTRTPDGHAWALSTGTLVPVENDYTENWK